jgi:hypothetical protein
MKTLSEEKALLVDTVKQHNYGPGRWAITATKSSLRGKVYYGFHFLSDGREEGPVGVWLRDRYGCYKMVVEVVIF